MIATPALSHARRIHPFAMSLLVVMGAGSHQASAQDTHDWIDPAGGVYGTFTKWTPVGFPAPLDTARFLLDETYRIAFIESRTVAELEVGNGSQVTFDGSGIFGVDDRLYTVNNASIAQGSALSLERVGNDRDINLDVLNQLDVGGEFYVLDSSIVTSEAATIDSGSNSFTALVDVRGAEPLGDRSTWSVPDLKLGVTNRGRFTVREGGHATSDVVMAGYGSGSFGDIQVHGSSPQGDPSTLATTSLTTPLTLGVDGRGNMFVTNGGIVASQDVVMGSSSSGEGTVRVSGVNAAGAPSSWATRGLTVGVGGGSGGQGELNVEDGGFVSSVNAVIGRGDVNVRGVDGLGNPSTWAVSELTVGDQTSIGSMNIIEDGHVSSETTYIGKQTGQGRVTVVGGGSPRLTTWANSGSVYVGGSATAPGGSGVLEIASESRVDIAETLKVWSTGSVDLLLGTLNADTIDHTDGGQFAFQSGVLQFDRFEGDLVNQGGTLAPGPGADTMVITGDYTQQAGGGLDIQIGGIVAGSSHDKVEVDEDTLLDGLLNLSVVDGFRPEATSAFEILSANSISGIFANAANGQRVTTTDGSGSFLVHYGVGSVFNPTRMFLTDFMSIAELAGDYNGSGQVEQGDLDLVLQNWGVDVDLAGVPSGWITDLPSGQIEQTELDGVLQNWGNTSAPDFSESSVPEPASLALFAAGGFALLRHCRCRCRLSNG